MAVGAVVTPTDPVVASSIVTGGLAERNIPERVRHLLSAESGANDALAYPLALPLAVLGGAKLLGTDGLLALSPWIGGVRSWGDALFLGWFGPIGIAALFYASFVLRESGLEEAWEVGSLLVTASVLVHGVSAAPLTRLYGRTGGRRRTHASIERA